MTGRDGRLQRVRTRGTAQRLGARKRRETATDQDVIPAAAVLVEEQHRLAAGTDARAQPRRLDFHQRDEPVHFRLLRRQLGKDATETERVVTELRSDTVFAAGPRVALINDDKHTPAPQLEPIRQLRGGWDFER